MLKIKIHDRTNMSFTGSKVLKSIMDTTTPGIDILVRESVQNSMDAVLENSDYARMHFYIDTFSSKRLSKKLEFINNNLDNLYQNDFYKFIAISDSSTCGLLGEPFLDDNSTKPHNLYNLVYDFMNGKEDSNAGGSWGIGKSVYYRYGAGLCFYYSRTFENGKYINKLAGALIQNEKSENCLLGEKSSGIAFFGDIEKGQSIPIYDETKIKLFLDIFNIDMYQGDKTGTVVIMPYIDEKKLISNRINHNKCFWENDLIDSLKIALQRWYFPKINNEKYNGKYLICGINNQKLVLNTFFSKLQDLYNEDVENATYEVVSHKSINNAKSSLGLLKYKQFSKDELGIGIVPENLPNPYTLLDIQEDNLEGNQEILFYTRKPGMIVTYDVDKFGKYNILDDQYLIGIFVLNDDLMIGDEKLGSYIRLTEKANHKEWIDGVFDAFPYFSSHKPFSKICNSIKRTLSEEFSNNVFTKIDGAHSIFQKKLGKMLMPPEDYGTEPTPKKSSNSAQTKMSPINSKKKISIQFEGFRNEFLLYSLEFSLNKNENLEFLIKIQTINKTISFDEWEKLGFDFPCSIYSIEFVEYLIDNNSFPLAIKKNVDDDFYKIMCKRNINNIPIFSFTGIFSKEDILKGLKVHNDYDKIIRLKFNILVEPIDLTYNVAFDSSFQIGGIKDVQ